MTTWNYRVFRSFEPDGTTAYTIREAHYDGDRIVSWSKEPVWPMGVEAHSLASDLMYMVAALGKPILDDRDARVVGEMVSKHPTRHSDKPDTAPALRLVVVENA